jgi:hypothetical protein
VTRAKDGMRRAATPLGNADGYQNKGFAGKGICKVMKTKGRTKYGLFIRKVTAWEGGF